MTRNGRRRAAAGKIGVLITGVGTGSTGEQIYRTLRSSRRRSYDLTITNVDRARLTVGNGARQTVLPAADHADYTAALARTAEAVRARFIFPGSDAELHRLAADGPQLAGLTSAIIVTNRSDVIALCADKQATSHAIARAGLLAPVTVPCTSVDAAVDAASRGVLRYPVVVKPKHSRGGSTNVHVAQDETELRFFVSYTLHSERELVLQDYVGSPDHEYSVSVVHYPDGTLAGSMAIRRSLTSLLSTRLRVANRTPRVDLGPWLAISTGFSQGEIDQFPEVRRAAERIASVLGSAGPVNVQGRLVGHDFYVFEINPRFSGSTALRARAGHNGPEALLDWHLGTPRRFRVRRARFSRGVSDYVVFP